LPVHQECAGNRQFPLAACAIGIFKGMAELAIKVNQFVAEFKYDAELPAARVLCRVNS